MVLFVVLHIPQHLAIHLDPVGYGPQQLARMDQVVLVFVQPVQVVIVDFEFEIWRDPGRLDGGEVNAFDGRFGVGIGDIPGACQSIDSGWTVKKAYIAQIPVPVPISRIFCIMRSVFLFGSGGKQTYLRVFHRRQIELSVETQRPEMVAATISDIKLSTDHFL